MTDVGDEALDLLSIKEVATRLRVSQATVRRLIYEWDRQPGSGLESVRLGSRRLVAPEAVIDYKSRLRAAAGKPAA